MKQLVLGAGPLGTAQILADGGEDVQLFSIMNNPAYDMPGTQPQPLDATDPEQLERACEGVEVVYLCLNAHYVDWYALFLFG